MRTTLDLDADLLLQAQRACGARTRTETIELGLQRLVELAAARDLAAMFGSDPQARATPRRRSPGSEGEAH